MINRLNKLAELTGEPLIYCTLMLHQFDSLEVVKASRALLQEQYYMEGGEDLAIWLLDPGVIDTIKGERPYSATVLFERCLKQSPDLRRSSDLRDALPSPRGHP